MKLYEFASGRVINLEQVVLIEPYGKHGDGCRIHLSNSMNIKLTDTSIQEFVEDIR